MYLYFDVYPVHQFSTTTDVIAYVNNLVKSKILRRYCVICEYTEKLNPITGWI